MKKRFLVLFLVALLMLPAIDSARAAQYHAPATAAEQALDNALHLDASGAGLLVNQNADRPSYNAQLASQYAALFTPQLIAAVTNADKQKTQQNCNGDYTQGSCGINYGVLLCAQNAPDAFQYRTLSSSTQQSIVAYSWPGSNTDTGIYRLVNEGGAWKIDGIDCSGVTSDRFNM